MGKKYTQANRPLAVTVEGLEPDTLLLVGFRGEEAISSLFHYWLDVLVENPGQVPFEKLLGKSVTVEVEAQRGKRPREYKRYFNGICQRVTQGERDDKFTHYRLDVVPKAWRLTKIARSRIFQHVAVVDILKDLLKGIDTDLHGDPADVAYKPLEPGKSPFEKRTPDLAPSPRRRDYCVQYRETDFNFISRLMAEEGFYYYFEHGAERGGPASHKMVMTNGDFGTMGSNVHYRKAGGGGEGYSVHSWEKMQELRAGKVTLRDHTFEKPKSDLQESRDVQPDVKVGKVNHKLNGVNAGLELYDYPGQYAKRVDGIKESGAEQPKEIDDLFPDAKRTARIRMEQETTAAVAIHGTSDCPVFTAGHSFYLLVEKGSVEEQAQAEGQYRLTSVQHNFALPGGYTSGDNGGFYYRNTFTCAPDTLPYRPQRTVPKPVIAGTQTAVVVGPKDEEIATDKYGRVKVQFFWDREGKDDLDSSCWIRVAQFWAGRRWGGHFWPRVGQEVIVAFMEGDPDQPIIVGSVYNADNMPPYDMPKNKTRSGIKTHSTPKGEPDNFNEIRFEDKKGAEELHVQAERNLTVLVKACEIRAVGGDCVTSVGGVTAMHVGGSSTKGKPLGQDWAMKTIIDNGSYYLGMENGNCYIDSKDNIGLRSLAKDIQLDANEGSIVLDAKAGISLQCGGGIIKIDSGGNIFISGTSVHINPASAPAAVQPTAVTKPAAAGAIPPPPAATPSSSDPVGAGAGSYSR